MLKYSLNLGFLRGTVFFVVNIPLFGYFLTVQHLDFAQLFPVRADILVIISKGQIPRAQEQEKSSHLCRLEIPRRQELCLSHCRSVLSKQTILNANGTLSKYLQGDLQAQHTKGPWQWDKGIALTPLNTCQRWFRLASPHASPSTSLLQPCWLFQILKCFQSVKSQRAKPAECPCPHGGSLSIECRVSAWHTGGLQGFPLCRCLYCFLNVSNATPCTDL